MVCRRAAVHQPPGLPLLPPNLMRSQTQNSILGLDLNGERTSCSFYNDMVVYLCFDSLADTRKKKPHMLRSDDRELR